MAESDALTILRMTSAADWDNWRASSSENSIDLSCLSLQKADLGNRNLRGVDFSNADLSYADLRNSTLEGANFSGANLQEADLTGVTANGAEFQSANLRGANLGRAVLSGSNFAQSNLAYADLSYTTLKDSHFGRSNLAYANLAYAAISNSHFERSNLAYAHLAYAKIEGSHFEQSNLRNADLKAAEVRYSHFEEASFLDADLSSAIFSLANLQDSSLRGATLIETDFTTADLSRTDLVWALATIKETYRSTDIHHFMGLSNTRGLPDLYELGTTLINNAYGGLGFVAAISLRGVSRILPVIFGVCWLAYEILQLGRRTLPDIAITAIPNAFAAPENRTTYVPPLGLSQGKFDIIVFLFVVVLFVMMLTLIWAGYVAKTKSTKAATLCEHFGTFLLGAFFGHQGISQL